MECRVNIPYPLVKVEKENIEYANILLEDYTGFNGEENAINQYVYEYLSKFNEYEYFAQVLKKIAMVEMKHLELIGKTITLLGGKPIFKFLDRKSNYYLYYSGSFVNYENDIKKMLIYNIRLEKNTIRKYEQHIKIIKDKYIKALLYRIILDEKKHIECFRELLFRLSKQD